MDPVASAQVDTGFLGMYPQDPPHYRGGIEASTISPINPTSTAYKGTAGSSSITFEVASSGNEMIDLSECYFETQFLVQRNLHGGDGGDHWGPCVDGDRVGLKNAASALMWSRVEVRLNGTTVSDSIHNTANWGPGTASFFDRVLNKNAPYGQHNQSKAFIAAASNTGNNAYTQPGQNVSADHINNVIGYTGSAAGGTSILEGYAFADAPQPPRDAAGAEIGDLRTDWVACGENDTRPGSSAKVALNLPCLSSIDTNPTVLIYKPAMSLFDQPTLLPPGSRLSITLFKNPAAMFLQSDIISANHVNSSITDVQANYQLCRMWVKRVQPNTKALSLVKQYLERVPYRFSFIARRAWSDVVTPDVIEYRAGSILAGPLPAFVHVFLSRGLLSTTTQQNARCSPWAMSPESQIAGIDAKSGVGPEIATAYLPQVQELYIRAGGQQWPRDSFKADVGVRGSGMRAYNAYLEAAKKSMFGPDQPVLSYSQFVGNYLFFAIPLVADPANATAGSISASTAALASSSGLEIYVKFAKKTAKDDVLVGAAPLRIAAVAESPASIMVNAQGGVSRVGF